MNNACVLLSSACDAFKYAAVALNGPLERQVESSAASIWDLRSRHWQIKGRFMRTKTLIIEDPIFVDDAEHAFGDTLSTWEDLGAGGVAAAALECKIAEQRLQHATRNVLSENIPESLLEALHSVLTLYEDVQQLQDSVSGSVEKEIFENSLQCIQQIAGQLGHGYNEAIENGATSSSPSSRPSSQAFAALASVIAHHGLSSEWTIGFFQPQLQDIVPVLLSLAEERKKETTDDGRKTRFAPIAILRILGQLEIASPAVISQVAAASDAHVLPRALVDLIPLEHSVHEGTDNPAAGAGGVVWEVCIFVQEILVQLTKHTTSETHNSTSLAASISESLLHLLLGASKGISTIALYRQESTRHISQVADWIFSDRSIPQSAVHQKCIRHSVSSVPWEWLAAYCPSKLRLQWLLAAVSAVKALNEGEDRSGGETAAAMDSLSELLSSKHGWNFTMACFQGTDTAAAAAAAEGKGEEEDEGRMLCLLEAPPSEPAAVLLIWRQIQATVALALCTTWMQRNHREIIINIENRSHRDSMNEDVATLLEGARVPDALTQIVQSRHRTAAVSILSHVVQSASSTSEFLSALYPTLSLTLSAALLSDDAAAATASVIVMEKAVSEAVHACTCTNGDSFAPLATWIGLFVGIVAQHDGLRSISASPVVVTLIAKLTRTVYSFISEKRKLVWLLLHLANALRDQPVSQTMESIAQLLSGVVSGTGSSGEFNELFAWLRVLGAWIADASSLGSRMPQHGVGSWSISDAEGALGVVGTFPFSSSTPPPEESEAAANEVFILQDAIQTIQSTASIPALVLCYELFYRIENNRAALSPLVDRQELATCIGSIRQKISSQSPELADQVTTLLTILENDVELSVEARLLPFVGHFSTVKEVTTVLAPTWLQEDWKVPSSAAPVDILSTDFAASVSLDERAAAAAAAVAPPPRQPVPSSSAAASDNFLKHQQQEQAASLAAAQEELRYWVRQSEKAAARPEGEEPSPDQGKEGDIPQPLASAQRHLWELDQRQSEELSHVHAALRQKVCQQYNTIDEHFLQEASEAFSDGDRIPRAMLLRDSNHSAQCRELRNQAFQIALSITSAKELSLAAKNLFTFEYLILEAVEKGEAVKERSGIRSKLLSVLAHSLVNGSTPATAVPYMIGLFERAVTKYKVVLDTDAKLRLIPRIAASLHSSGAATMSGAAGAGGAAPVLYGVLKEKEGMRLLNACLDPDALLNAGKLREFMTALQLIVGLHSPNKCSSGAADADVGSGQPSAMLSSFDAQRFAVLVAEKPGAVRAHSASSTSSSGAGGSHSSTAASSSSSKNKSKEVGIEEVLMLAVECLTYPSSAPTGAALVEGILNLHATSLYAACLGVVLNAPSTGRRDTMLSMLSQIPMEMLEPPVLAEALSLLTQSLHSGRNDPPDLPYELLRALVRAVPVLESIRTTIKESVNGRTSTTAKVESYSMKKSAWTTSLHPSQSLPTAAITLQPINASYPPLHTLAEYLLQAAMDAVVRSLRSSSSSIGSSSNSGDLLQPLFGIIFELAEVCGLHWLWIFYQTHLCSLIADADKATSSTACAAAFQHYWASLPWNQQATFHVESPEEIATIRAYLPSADYAAARLVHDLDWMPIVTAILPMRALAHKHPPGSNRSNAAMGAGVSASGGGDIDGVFTLLDETEDDNALITASVISATHQHESTPPGNENVSLHTSIDLNRYPRKQWAAEFGLLLLHCSIFLPDSPVGIPGWAQKLLLGRETVLSLNSDSTILLDAGGEESGGVVEGEKIQNEEEGVEIIRLLASADWHLIDSILSPSSSSTSESATSISSSDANSGVYGKVPWLVLPLLLAPQSIYGEGGERVVHAAYVLGRAAEKEGSATAARVVAKTVRPLLAFSICQGIQISTDQQGLRGGGGGRAVQEAATAAALAASIASHQLVDIPSDIPEELLEGTVELEQLRLQREQIRIAQEEAATAAAAAGAAPTSPSQNTVPSTDSTAPIIEVSGCFRFTPAQHVTLLRDVLGPLAAKHAQQPLNIVAEQCTPDLEPPSENNGDAVLLWDSPSLAAFKMAWQTEEEQNKARKEEKKEPAAEAAAAVLCVSLLQPLVQDPVTILTQDSLPYSNADLPWIVENTCKAVFISNVLGGGSGSSSSGGGGGGGGQQLTGVPRERPGGRSMRALRRQISSLLRRRDAQTTSLFTGQDSSASFMDDPDMALNQHVTDALSLRNLMGHVIEDAAVRAVYSVQHGKRLGACLLRCIILTPSIYQSVFVAHVAENILRGLTLTSPTAELMNSTATNDTAIVGGSSILNNQGQVHAAEEIPVIAASSENSSTIKTTMLDNASVSISNVFVPDSMHFAAVASTDLEPRYLLQFAQAAAMMRRPFLTTYALASARHAATLLDKITWQALVVEALKVIQQSESNAEHPLDVLAPWLESLKWIGDTRWRRLPSGPHKVALNDVLSSLNTRVQIIEVLTAEELDETAQQQQERGERRNPLLGVANAANAAAVRVRRQLGHSSTPSASSQGDGVIPHGQEPTATTVPAGIPVSISEFESVQLSGSELPTSTSQASFLGPPEEDPSLSKKVASGFRNFGKSMSQASSRLKNKLADGEKTTFPSTTTTGIGGEVTRGGAVAGSSVSSTPTTLPSPSRLLESSSSSIDPERDHLVRVGLAAYAITSYITSVMDPTLTRRTISGAEPSSPKHLRTPSSAFTTNFGGSTPTSSSVHVRGNSSLTGSRHLEEAQISELDTVLEAREAVDYLLELEATPLLAQHRHVYAGFFDGVPQLLTARTGVQTFVMAVVRMLVPNEEEAGQLLALLTHSGA